MTRTSINRHCAAAAFALAILVAAGGANALDAAYSHKGPFAGFGLGGGVSLMGGGELTPLGDVGLALQAGVGANDHITLAFNLDMRLEIGNEMTMGLFVPGPELTFFLVKGLFLQVGVGLAIATSDDIGGTAIGLDAGAALGYEFWVNTNWAAYLSGGVDYFLLNDASDVVNFGLWFGLKYY